jgi:ubiquinone/menaquinone biosynthesis C-methylase UbiE
MLLRLREKLPFARIAQADATALPFPSAYFDIVMTAHVLHLVPAWREAVQEFRRVLTPGGAYLNLKTWANVGVSVREQMRLHWRGWLASHGVNAELPGLQANTEMQEELQSLGAQLTEVEVAHYSLLFTLREELERFARRIYSDSWEIPDPIFEASVEELETWAAHEYGDLDQQRQGEVRFSIDVARFAG